MIWAVVTSLMPCSAENFSRSGTRAIVPSSFMISQITPAGLSPASRERSTAASVCPARCRTPPPLARSGKTCPGITRSSGPVASSTATRQVWARSAAEMPVVMPSLASMETVKPVPMREELCTVICGMSSLSMSSSAIGRQMRPRPWVAMKFMSSAVTSSAAIVRSPSFSRSSSSQTITILPALMSSSISSIGLNGISRSPLGMGNFPACPGLHEPLDVLSYYIGLQVDAGPDPELAEVGVGTAGGEDGCGEAVLVDGDRREAYAVDADAALFDRVAQHRRRRPERPNLRIALGPHVEHLADAVHVPLHDVPPEASSGLHSSLQVDRAALAEIPEGRPSQGLGHRVEDEAAVVDLVHRQARPVDRYGVAHARPPEPHPGGGAPGGAA